jgi:hypothetical protein
MSHMNHISIAHSSGSPLGFINGLPNVPAADKTQVRLSKSPSIALLTFSSLQYDNHTSDFSFTPTGSWNYAIDPSTLAVHTNTTNSPLPYLVWGTAAQPLSMTATACQINWGVINNAAGNPPPSPATCTGAHTTVTLRPYGGTRLRIGQIPTFKS